MARRHSTKELDVVARDASLEALLADLGWPLDYRTENYQRAAATLRHMLAYDYNRGQRDAHEVQVRHLNEAYSKTRQELGF